jgi:hypothetical protein
VLDERVQAAAVVTPERLVLDGGEDALAAFLVAVDVHPAASRPLPVAVGGGAAPLAAHGRPCQYHHAV